MLLLRALCSLHSPRALVIWIMSVSGKLRMSSAGKVDDDVAPRWEDVRGLHWPSNRPPHHLATSAFVRGTGSVEAEKVSFASNFVDGKTGGYHDEPIISEEEETCASQSPATRSVKTEKASFMSSFVDEKSGGSEEKGEEAEACGSQPPTKPHSDEEFFRFLNQEDRKHHEVSQELSFPDWQFRRWTYSCSKCDFAPTQYRQAFDEHSARYPGGHGDPVYDLAYHRCGMCGANVPHTPLHLKDHVEKIHQCSLFDYHRAFIRNQLWYNVLTSKTSGGDLKAKAKITARRLRQERRNRVSQEKKKVKQRVEIGARHDSVETIVLD